MNLDNTLLDALTQRGVLINVSVRYWRACKKLNPEDLGLSRVQVDDRLISLGHKRLVPKESLKQLALLEGRAHALVEENTFPFLGGIAHYLPNAKLGEVNDKLQAVREDFGMEQQAFLARYSELREAALNEWRTVAQGLVDDPARLLAVIGSAFPSADKMPRYFSFDIRTFQIAVPDVPQAQLIDIATQQELIEVRRQAAEEARREIGHSCQEFVADCVATLREQTATLCSEMLQTIDGTKSVHQKPLNRLVRFIDHFRELNFAQDSEMEEQLERIRREFLGRTAGEYRDSDFARAKLVNGLATLRDRASDMAKADIAELVDGFGKLGTRKFALAA